MADQKRAVLITGISGSLGLRLLPQLQAFDVTGVDIAPLRAPLPVRYASLDLGDESSCRAMVELLRETNARAVVHLAFIVEPARTRIFDPRRQWQVNVAGTARVMEAITEVNRSGGSVDKFIFASSAQVYGPDLDSPVTETSALSAHTLSYAVHKRAADEVVQYRASTLGACDTFILRSQSYAGPDVHNYFLDALCGIPTGHGERAIRWRRNHKRVPFFIPFGDRHPQNLRQFVHIDDMARLIAHILKRPSDDGRTTVLNVSGRDGSLSLERCFDLSGTRVFRLPGRAACGTGMRFLFNRGISATPPEALPYLLGSNPLDTNRLRAFLGREYQNVIRYSTESALCDSFVTSAAESSLLETVAK